MIQFCSRHRIGYNDELDPVCPQCSLAHIEPADVYEVDQLTLDVKIPKDAANKRPVNLSGKR